MLRTVDVPLWLLLLILAFAAVTFASHFLFPSVRWFFRRRMERAVAELNKRLERPIQPFKLARRHDMIQRLIYDTQVIQAVAEHAHAEGVPENVAAETAQRYAREIVPRFSATVYFGPAVRLARWFSEAIYTVEVDGGAEAALQGIDPEATVVFVMNHRSNIDYVLVTYLVAPNSALSYAVGEWARVWPLSALIRAMGAYFIRRRARTALYRRVLARYVQMATASGVTQAVFPEGGLSLTGGIATPKLGLMSYMIDGADLARRDVVFVPVALNYDRVLEDRTLIEAAAAGTRRFRSPISRAVGYATRFLWRRITGQVKRMGRAGVSFGAPLSMRAHLDAGGAREAAVVSRELMRRLRGAVPVLPVPLVAALLQRADHPMPREELAQQATRTLDVMAVPRRGPKDAAAFCAEGIEALLVRGLLTETTEGLSPAPGEGPILEYYARSVLHHLDASAA